MKNEYLDQGGFDGGIFSSAPGVSHPFAFPGITFKGSDCVPFYGWNPLRWLFRRPLFWFVTFHFETVAPPVLELKHLVWVDGQWVATEIESFDNGKEQEQNAIDSGDGLPNAGAGQGAG